MPLYGLATRSPMDDFIADFFSNAGKDVNRYPLTNIGYDSEDTLHIQLALAGFSKEDLTIDLKGDILTIVGVKPSTYEDITWMHHNVSSKDFERRISLGENYIGSAVQAKMTNGILDIIIKSTEPDKTVIAIE